jgi:WhiB family redox-sensing transcriptional regulator
VRRNAVYGVPVMQPDDWKAQGACREYGLPDLWFSTDEEHIAVAVCQGCQMLRRCRDTALANKETFGTWGGLTQRQLRNLVKGEA